VQRASRGIRRPDIEGATAHYEDPAYYDVAYRSRRDDIAYYVRACQVIGGPVLEYGIGTGRIALPLARAGLSVTGVDRSKPMLAALARRMEAEPREVQRRLRAVEGDMRRVRLARRFGVVIAAFNTVLHLIERRDFELFFERVRQHLSPRGRFLFDFSVPHPDYLGADPERRYGAPRFRHPTRGVVRYGERFDYEPFRQILHMQLEFTPAQGRAGDGWTVPLTHRQLFPQEVEALLHYNGFCDLEWSADFSDAPPETAVDSLVVSCRSRRLHGRR
jgi:SAM-dependent methyltransferase